MADHTSDQTESAPGEVSKPGTWALFWRTLLSTLAAAFGVQSERSRQRDFEHGSIWAFIAAALIFVVVFILAIYGIVQLVLRQAG